MPQATDTAAATAREQCIQQLESCGVIPRCTNAPLSLVPYTEDAITAQLFGIPDECLALFKSLEKLAPVFWAFEFSDLSTCLVEVMAICLAQGCMFRDQATNSRVSTGSAVQIPANMTCSVPRQSFSGARRPTDPPAESKTAFSCARDVAETFTELVLSNQGIVGYGTSTAFAAQIAEVCDNALTAQRFHNDEGPLMPGTHIIEYANIETGSLDYIQCIALCRPHARVRRWAHNTSAMQLCGVCGTYIVGDIGQPLCAANHRPWPCRKYTHEYATTIRSMGAWSWYRRNNAGSTREVKPVLRIGDGILRHPEPDMQSKACYVQDCGLAEKGCITCSKVMCATHARTCMTCTEGWLCDACLVAHIGNTCVHTAQGLRLGVQGRIPRTPHDRVAAAYVLLQSQDADQSAFDNRGLPAVEPPYSQDELKMAEYIKDIRAAKPSILFGMNAVQVEQGIRQRFPLARGLEQAIEEMKECVSDFARFIQHFGDIPPPPPKRHCSRSIFELHQTA